MNKKIARTAIISALYFVLTVAIAPLSYGPVQFRFSECLTMLAVFYPEAVIGLTVGCFFSNLFGNGLLDIIFGTFATFISSLLTYIICKKQQKILIKSMVCIIFNVLFNAFLVPISFMGYSSTIKAYFLGVLSVGFGQLVVLSSLGVVLAISFNKISEKNRFLH